MHQDQQKVGDELAELVADRLDSGNELFYSHRDYCGMGLCKDGTSYIYGTVGCGRFTPTSTVRDLRSKGHVIEHHEFLDRTSFVEWLSDQTDSSLKGDDNQRITLHRLKQFVAESAQVLRRDA